MSFLYGKRRPTVCVIGAGASGLTAIKTCVTAGFEVTCFEATDDLGGRWKYREEVVDGVPSIMKTSVSLNSKEAMAFSDFPPPGDSPNFMRHDRLLEYLRSYAKKFNLSKHIQYNTKVNQVVPANDYDTTGAWMVTTNKGTNRFDAVLMAHGYHAVPSQAKINGIEKFKGKVLHSRGYKTPKPFLNQRVVVVGTGNSALDVATDMAKFSAQVYLSTRNGVWISSRTPTYGVPHDLDSRGTWWLKELVGPELTSTYLEGRNDQFIDHETQGLAPQHRMAKQHPTKNNLVSNFIQSGQIILADDIVDMEGNSVTFKNGSRLEDIDAIICATGYNVEFKFLDYSIITVTQDNKVDLFMQMFPTHLQHPTLAAIGFIQTSLGDTAIVELQCRYMVQLLKGSATFPSMIEMKDRLKAYRLKMRDRFLDTPRHSFQVDAMSYSDDLAAEIGCKPNLVQLMKSDPRLAMQVAFGPHLPYVYRLQGPDAWTGARQAIIDVRKNMGEPHKHLERGSPMVSCEESIQFYALATALVWVYTLLWANLAVYLTGGFNATSIGIFPIVIFIGMGMIWVHNYDAKLLPLTYISQFQMRKVSRRHGRALAVITVLLIISSFYNVNYVLAEKLKFRCEI